jgi:hypothetical protein
VDLQQIKTKRNLNQNYTRHVNFQVLIRHTPLPEFGVFTIKQNTIHLNSPEPAMSCSAEHDHSHSHGDDGHGHVHDHSDDITPALQHSLYQQINFDEVTTLNETVRDSGRAIVRKTWAERLSEDPELASDADEQILMNIPLRLLP